VQLPLDLPHRQAMGAADFMVSPCNADAVALLDRWPAWPGPALVVHGPAGCGKTHLTHVWRAQSGAVAIDRLALTSEAVPELLGDAVACVVEDVDRGIDETALFHLHNLLAGQGGYLLLTARAPAAHWGLSLPDLASRMGAAMSVAVGAPDEALIGGVMLKLFADRQLKVEPAVVTFLLARMERSFAAAKDLAAALDAAALAEKRRITVPLAREVLGRLEEQCSE
jgi:chromosomal replication initiation ATPase DnaA